MTDDRPVELRPYDPNEAIDRRGLWACKRAFETGLGDAGSEAKAAAYDAKLTDDYRAEWLDWVARCVRDDPGCVVVAAPAASGGDHSDAAAPGEGDAADGPRAPALAGYAFLLPERLAFVWDAAVLNELYVVPPHRGTGLADRLLEHVVAHARDQSLPLDRLVLDVDRENGRARAFYERHGFEHWGEMVAREL